MSRARRFAFAFVLASLLCSRTGQAAGTVIVSSAGEVGADVTRYVYTWTSTGGGAVSGDTTTIVLRAGDVIKAELVPGSGGTQPTDQYDLTLLDANSVDVLGGAGANLSNASSLIVVGPLVWVDNNEPLQLVVANAGSAKQGRVILWVQRHVVPIR